MVTYVLTLLVEKNIYVIRIVSQIFIRFLLAVIMFSEVRYTLHVFQKL